jgi:hypothetical protein
MFEKSSGPECKSAVRFAEGRFFKLSQVELRRRSRFLSLTYGSYFPSGLIDRLQTWFDQHGRIFGEEECEGCIDRLGLRQNLLARPSPPRHVRYWHLADIDVSAEYVCSWE